MVFHVALDKGLPAGWGRWPYSSVWGHGESTGEAMPGVLCPVLVSPGQERWVACRVWHRATNILKGQEHPSSEERLDCLAQRRDGSGTISHIWKEDAKRAESGSFQFFPVTGIIVNRSKMKLRSIRKDLVRVIEHLDRLLWSGMLWSLYLWRGPGHALSNLL